MWFLIATMFVMGHLQVHVEKFDTQKACLARIQYINDRIEHRDVTINMVCETDA